MCVGVRGVDTADVWAPELATTHGQVVWTAQGNGPIPQAIWERFKGGTVAIMGRIMGR